MDRIQKETVKSEVRILILENSRRRAALCNFSIILMDHAALGHERRSKSHPGVLLDGKT